MRDRKIITIFGGSGFIGINLIKQLLKNEYKIQIVSRTCENLPEFEEFIKNGFLTFIKGDLKDLNLIEKYVSDSWAFINLVGLLFEKRSGDFLTIHNKAAQKIALLANKIGVEKFIHISALGIDKALTSEYARTKLAGENLVLKEFPTATIIRPSIVFGSEDNIFNQFAQMAKFSPILPLIGGGATKFQPVYVQDVANTVIAILQSNDFAGKIFELTGPTIVSFKEILIFILKTIDKKRLLLNLPFFIAKIIGRLANLLPNPPLTADQVELLKYDNVNSNRYLGFEDITIDPRTIEEIVPEYLMKYK